MELETFKDLGIAGVAVGAMAYICFQVLKQLGNARKDYKDYVSENNHTTTELVKESTATMVEVKNSIENHNKVLEKLIEKI